MNVIPLAPVPSQILTINLAGQNCLISVYLLGENLYLDFSLSNRTILSGVLCHDRVKLVQLDYFGFVGDIAFFDSQGTNDPTYDGFGSRYFLAYLE